MESKEYICTHYESLETKKCIRIKNPHERNLSVTITEFGPDAGWSAKPNPEWAPFEHEAQENKIMVGDDFIKGNTYYEHQIDFTTEMPTLKPVFYADQVKAIIGEVLKDNIGGHLNSLAIDEIMIDIDKYLK